MMTKKRFLITNKCSKLAYHTERGRGADPVGAGGGIHHVLGGIGQQRGRDGVDETLYEESSGTEDIVGCGEDIGSGWRWRTEL